MGSEGGNAAHDVTERPELFFCYGGSGWVIEHRGRVVKGPFPTYAELVAAYESDLAAALAEVADEPEE